MSSYNFVRGKASRSRLLEGIPLPIMGKHPVPDYLTSCIEIMSSDNLLQRLSKEIKAPNTTKSRIRATVLQSIKEESGILFMESTEKRDVNTELIKARIWERIHARIAAPQAFSAFLNLRALLTPADLMRKNIQFRFKSQNLPFTVPMVWPQRFIKLTATFALLAIAVRVSPFLFLPSPTIADSSVILLPTRGEVSVSIGGLWQPIDDEIVLEPGMMLRTYDGEASILFHDDGVIRMAENTTVQISDTADRSDPVTSDILTTVTLYIGKVWVQGLIPSHIRGITVATDFGKVTVNEGSVLIADNNIVDVAVYDRRAIVSHNGHEIFLVAGGRTQLWDGNVPMIKKIQASRYEEGWENQNLGRDSVHRKEIAQLQQERRAARAGILPTSTFYPVKRVAEKVDVLLTFSSEAKTQKRIDQADRRLDEAAALLSDNQNIDAERSLVEYRDTLLELAEETKESGLTNFLLQQSIISASTDIAAVLPDDNGYLLKLAVLEASTVLGANSNTNELEAILLMDALASINRSINEGNWQAAYDEWLSIQSSLPEFGDEGYVLPADVQKELNVLLGRFAMLAEENAQGFAGIDAAFVKQVAKYIPADLQETETVTILSDEEIDNLVKDIRDRIFVYHMQRPRLNQLITELSALKNHPEEGRILRRLYTELPNGPENLPDRVQKEITRLRWDKAVEM